LNNPSWIARNRTTPDRIHAEYSDMWLALLSIVGFTFISVPACGRPRDHVYRSRLTSHYGAYVKDNRKVPPTADTLDLNENGTCVHTYLKVGETTRTEELCTWTL